MLEFLLIVVWLLVVACIILFLYGLRMKKEVDRLQKVIEDTYKEIDRIKSVNSLLAKEIDNLLPEEPYEFIIN